MNYKSRLLSLFFLLLISLNTFAANIILVTGFEPFGGSKVNGSWEAVKNLNGKHVGDKEIVVAMLPVLWDIAAANLQSLVKAYQPVMIIGFGEAALLPIQLETIAHNQRGNWLDNHNNRPKTSFIYQNGPAEIKTALPIPQIQSAIIKQKLPYNISNNAGDYLCNEIFYTIMFDPGTEEAKKIPRGFVHVPPYLSQIKNDNGETIVFDQVTLQLTAESIITAAAL